MLTFSGQMVEHKMLMGPQTQPKFSMNSSSVLKHILVVKQVAIENAIFLTTDKLISLVYLEIVFMVNFQTDVQCMFRNSSMQMVVVRLSIASSHPAVNQ